MNRRSFLQLLGQATASAAVVYSFPSIIVPKNIQPVVDSYFMAPYGLAYFVNQGGAFRGLSTSAFPDLNGPSTDLSGAVLTPQMFEYAQRTINAIYWNTKENSMLSFP
jgi:hypothetical protein